MEIHGYIHGRNLGEIVFSYDSLQPDGSPTDIELGQLLMVPDQSGMGEFLVRVTDIEFGQTVWAEEVARNLKDLRYLNVKDEHEHPTEVYQSDQKNQLLYHALCEPLGYISPDQHFLSVKRPPSYFSPVRKISAEDFEGDFGEKVGDLPLGNLRSASSEMNVRAGLFKKLLPYHVGLFAKTGGGKSNAMKVLLRSIMATRGEAGALIFDPHGEYIQDLNRHPLAKETLVSFAQEARNTARKIRLSYEDISIEALLNVRDQLHWSDAQERLLREASYDHGRGWLQVLTDTPVSEEERKGDPTDLSFLEGDGDEKTLQQLFPDYKDDTLKATRSKLRQVLDAPYIVRDRSVSNVEEILTLLEQGKTVLVDMASLVGLHELLLSTVLATKVMGKRRLAYSKNREQLMREAPSVSIVMEEAQRVLGKHTNQSSVFAQICNEGRKFKVGLIAITQQPKLMNEILMSQFNSLIILAITDEADFKVLNSIAQKPIHKLSREIGALMPGQAIITSSDAPFAVPLKIDFYEDVIKRDQKEYEGDRKAPGIDRFKGFT
ncbi:ATP-binding protein (plasmid) [Pontibacillus sp. ALD_SL1]|uniref:ATP-binding protein n=1 Tax=Pontibacillus sp. ALD_SL1 TaxID=2777185 RepID=UPI001A97C892|nr:ATP-binding protein [Pontibacillus sp. ALD_SL1]QST02910.1 ATP-binding protein [Pontibacillus sp. ALD_SL1]